MNLEDAVVLPEKWIQPLDVLCRKLDKKDKKQLVKFIARISEASYRRGVQHTFYLSSEGVIPKKIVNDGAASFRFDTSLDKSKGLMSRDKMSSVARLMEQYCIWQTGLSENIL